MRSWQALPITVFVVAVLIPLAYQFIVWVSNV